MAKVPRKAVILLLLLLLNINISINNNIIITTTNITIILILLYSGSIVVMLKYPGSQQCQSEALEKVFR